MATLEQEIEAYGAMRVELERDHFNEWVVIHEGQAAGFFDTSEDCTRFAIERFGRGPYLIRQIGAPPTTLPVSALFGGIRARN